MGMYVCLLWKKMVVSASAAEDITCLKVVQSTRTGLFNLGVVILFPELLSDR